MLGGLLGCKLGTPLNVGIALGWLERHSEAQNGPRVFASGVSSYTHPDSVNMSLAAVYGNDVSSHAHKFWLNELALWNMSFISVTPEVSQLDKSPSKDRAFSNIAPMLITLEVFQIDKLPVKAVALLNMLFIMVTLEVSQSDKSPSNAVAL